MQIYAVRVGHTLLPAPFTRCVIARITAQLWMLYTPALTYAEVLAIRTDRPPDRWPAVLMLVRKRAGGPITFVDTSQGSNAKRDAT